MNGTITKLYLAKMTPDEAAALFLVHKDQGKPVEAGVFDEWLSQSEQNEASWLAVEGAWSLFDESDDAAFNELRAAALAVVPKAADIALKRYWRPMFAAVVLGVIGTVAIQLGGFSGTLGLPGMDGGIEPHTYAGTASGPTDFVLSDGSRMTLKRGSSAIVSMATRDRRVELDRGEAEFAVRHDASRPFTVIAGDRTIVDLGTRFRVTLEHDAVRVALYEGSVSVGSTAGNILVLRPGEQLLASQSGGDMIMPIVSTGAGPTELVQFNNVTLAAAVETVSDGSLTTLIITDPSVAKLQISGRFRLRDPERFARSASELLSLRVVRLGPKRIELRRRR